jgi:hypothetical protein
VVEVRGGEGQAMDLVKLPAVAVLEEARQAG